MIIVLARRNKMLIIHGQITLCYKIIIQHILFSDSDLVQSLRKFYY